MQADTVTLHRHAGGIGVLTLNRPDKLNAFDVPMLAAWYDSLQRAIADSEISVIVLTGAGRAFCAGGDVEEILKFERQDALGRKDFLWQHVYRIVLTLERMDKPIIAAINGPARGAGLDMALMCDLRVCAQSATMAESYIELGLIAGDAGAWYLPRMIGPARALDLLWTGRSITADEALQIGLINRVAPDAELMTSVFNLAAEIAAKPQIAVRMFKRAVWQGLEMPLRAHLDMVSSHMSILGDTADHRARMGAFAARRRADTTR